MFVSPSILKTHFIGYIEILVDSSLVFSEYVSGFDEKSAINLIEDPFICT